MSGYYQSLMEYIVLFYFVIAQLQYNKPNYSFTKSISKIMFTNLIKHVNTRSCMNKIIQPQSIKHIFHQGNAQLT